MSLRRDRIGRKPAILILSRLEALAFRSPEPYAVVSITGPDQRMEKALGDRPQCRGVIHLQFDDIEHVSPNDYYTALMTEEQAQEVVKFVQEAVEHVSLLVIHCEAGMSRSAGVGAALGLYYHQSDRHFHEWYWPNAHVKSLVLRALGLPGPAPVMGASEQ